MEYFKVSFQNEVLKIGFNDLASLNSFSIYAARELDQIISKYKFHSLIFYSELEHFFCSGGNLKFYSNHSKDESLKINSELTNILNKLSNLDAITICYVNGQCIGGGIELISAFDYVFASPHSQFQFWQRKIGLSLAWGGSYRLSQRLNSKKIRNLILSENSLSAIEANKIGLIDKIIAPEFIEKRINMCISKEAKSAKDPIFAIKKLDSSNESELISKIWHNASHKLALAKFIKN